jgi:hypothetical protein
VGIGAMAAGAMMIGIFGAIPAIVAARQKRVNQENRNLAKAMGLSPSSSSLIKGREDLSEAREESDNSLAYSINQWNETFFKPRGLLIRIDMPYELSAVEDGLDVIKKSPSPSLLPLKHVSLSSISAGNGTPQEERHEASHRCRIVVIPQNRTPDSVVTLEMAPAAESPSTMSVVYQ